MEKIPYLLEDNFFTSEELNAIWVELEFLNRPSLMLDPDLTASATEWGEIKKKNRGVFLNNVYKHLDVSPIWVASRKLFSGYTFNFSELSMVNKVALETNHSSMLMSYYEDGDYYLPHRDTASVTTLYWFFREPKRFEGGDLIFTETGETVEVKHNRMIMFPSWAEHAVTNVALSDEFKNRGLGRYCVTHFLNIVH